MTRLSRQLVAALLAHLDGAKPRPPIAGVALWEAFVSLSRGRRYDHGLPLPLTGCEIAGYVGLQGAAFGLDHIRLIEAMDTAWLDWVTAKRTNPDKGAAISAAGFDAMFG